MEDWGRAHLAGARRTHHENPKFAHGWGIRGEATLRAGMSILKSGERPEYHLGSDSGFYGPASRL